MPNTHWSESFHIDKPLLVDRALLIHVFDGLTAIASEGNRLELTLQHGEKRTFVKSDEIDEIDESLLSRTTRIDITAHSETARVYAYFSKFSLSPFYIEVTSDNQRDVLFAKGLSGDLESRHAASGAEGAAVWGVTYQTMEPVTQLTTGSIESTKATMIREVPTELPHAKLYVDDLEEIAALLLAVAVSNRRPHPRVRLATESQIFPSFSAMLQQGGLSRHFTLSIEDAYISVRFYSLLPPRIELVGLAEDTQWAVYSKVKAIFDTRSYRFKNAVLALPLWIRIGAYLVWLTIPSSFAHSHSKVTMAAVLAVLIVVPALVGLELARRSVVIFKRFHAHKTWISERLQTYLQNILFTLLGAVLSVILQALYDHYKH
jgi:hypothetical protein